MSAPVMALVPERKKVRCRRMALVVAAMSSVCAPAIAQASSPVIAVGEPEGFGDLVREQELMVDVYFGGTRRGEALVRATPESVTFLDPAAVIAMLPPLSSGHLVLQTLSAGPLPANGELACTPSSDRTACGRLAPDDVGIILARDQFRLDIFLNPRFITIADRVEERYLPEPDKRLSLVNAIGGFVSGETGGGNAYVSIQNRLVVARGDKRLRADIGLDDTHLSANRLLVEWDRPERRYSAGLFWTPGNSLGGGTQVVGLGIESQIETRRDREQLLGSPVIVYLDRRARVDALYDGRVVSSRIYEAGNQQIDTSGLPEGTYELTLRIEEPGGIAREEPRLYSKSRRIPSLGRSDFYLFGGVVAGAGRRSPGDDAVLLQGGYSRRLSQALALDAQATLGDDYRSAEVGVTILSTIAQGRAAVVASDDGRIGTLLRVNSTGTGSLNYSFDLRALSAATESASPPLRIDDPFGGLGSMSRGTTQGYTQVGGLVSYSRGSFRLRGTLHLRDETEGDLRYAIGPSLEWDAARIGPAVLTFRGDVTATETGAAGFAGVALRFAGRRGSMTALGGYRRSTIEDDLRGNGPTGAVSGAWTSEALGGRVAAGAGYEYGSEEESALASLEFAHPYASIAGDLARTERRGEAATQYTAGLQTTLVAGRGAPASLIGKTSAASVVVARMAGARGEDLFEVLVDEHVAGHITGNRPSFLRLPAYQAYNVRVRPVGSGLVAYDSSSREVGLFPGTVTELRWDTAPIVIKLGRLVDVNGIPVALATITGKGVWTQTDKAGFFQLEAPEGVALEVTTQSGARYALDLPRQPGRGMDEPFVRLGAVACCQELLQGPATQLTQLTGPTARKEP
jgi:hypothetical protein